MQWNAENYGNKSAVVSEGRSLSWSELWRSVQAASAGIAGRLSDTQQDVVAILAPNSIEFVVAYLAVVHAGHIALPLDPAYKKLELDAIIDQIPSKIIIVTKEYRHNISDRYEPVILAEELMVGKGLPDRNKLLRFPAGEQIASLTFTSGTTGKPKAVPNTHQNQLWNIKVCSMVWDWTPEDTLLISLPLSHWYGIVMGLAGALYHGNTIHLQRWFDSKATLTALASGDITLFTHAASAYVKLIQEKDDYDLRGVRLCISGGAPLPPSVWLEFKKRFGIEILETYGSSETGRIAGNRLDERVLGSPGRILPEVNMKLSADNEVLIKSPGVFPGYYHNPEATKASTTSDGFWRTGDIAELKEGYIYLKGRVQERIRRFGYTVSPRDVEWALHQHPKISDVHVMGLQDSAEPNDELIYFIVSDLTDEQINDYCKTNLIFAWRPDKLVRLKELPRTRSGKVKIGDLKMEYAKKK